MQLKSENEITINVCKGSLTTQHYFRIQKSSQAGNHAQRELARQKPEYRLQHPWPVHRYAAWGRYLTLLTFRSIYTTPDPFKPV